MKRETLIPILFKFNTIIIFYITIFIIIILLSYSILLSLPFLLQVLSSILLLLLLTLLLTLFIIIVPIHLNSKQSLAIYITFLPLHMEWKRQQKTGTIQYLTEIVSSASITSYLLVSYKSVDFMTKNSVAVFCQ